MSEEQGFHKLIIKQNQEEKDSLWRKIEQQQDEEVIELGEVLGKKHRLKKKIIIIASSFICVLAVIAIVLACTYKMKKVDSIRYCVSDDYYCVDVDCSIEKYADDNGKELLFLDWYEESEYLIDQQYKLKTTDEVICLREELLDANGVYVIQHITDLNTKLDFLDLFQSNCGRSMMIKSYEIKLAVSSSAGQKAYFVYKNYVYYLSIEGKADEDYILNLVEELIK